MHTRECAQSIYIYDVSGLDDTATDYAGLEPAEGRPGRKEKIGAIDTEERLTRVGGEKQGRGESVRGERKHPRNVKRSDRLSFCGLLHFRST